MAGSTPPSGWYPDPLERATWRYWDGERWNARVADENQHTWVDQEFVAEERARAEAFGTPEGTVAPPPEPQVEPEPAAIAREAAEPLPESAAPKPKVPRVKQHRVRKAIALVRSRIAADLAAHWLAYIGVVLIFVGVFGFMVFSFREVTTWARPVAEVAIPLALVGAAWYLRKQGAPFVASLVAGLAGALVPIAIITAFNDGNDFPPDVMGVARPLLTGALCIAVGAAYAWWTTRRPDTPLRYLAAPAMWLGVGVGAGVFAADIPLGTHVARADAWQSAAMMIAIAGSLLVARWRPQHGLSRATMTAAFPGIGVVIAFVLAAVLPDGTWFGAGTAAALALLVAIDALEPRLRPTATAILDGLTVVAVSLTLVPRFDVGWALVVATFGLLVLAEWVARRATPNVVMLVMAVGAASAAIATVQFSGSAWAIVVAFAAVSIWAHVRRLAPVAWITEPDLITAVAAAAPAGLVYGLFMAVSPGVAAFTLAAIVLSVAASVRLSHTTGDDFWKAWIPAAFGVAEAAVVLFAFAPSAPMYVWLTGAAALLTGAAATMPMHVAWRRWITGAAALWTAWLAAAAFDIAMTGPAIRTVTLAVATVVVTLVARRLPERFALAAASIAAALGLGTLVSAGDWRALDTRGWVFAYAIYGGAVVLAVLGSTFVPRARRMLAVPWAFAGVVTVGTAVVQLLDRPVAFGRGAPGLTTAAAAAVVGAAAWVLVRRWGYRWLVEVGVVAFAAAGACLAVGVDMGRERVAIVALALSLLAAIWTAVVGPTPDPTPPRRASLLQRGGLEVMAVTAVFALTSVSLLGEFGWLNAAALGVIAVEGLMVAIRWRMPNLSYLSAVATGASLVVFGAWAGWTVPTWVVVSAVAAAVVVVLATLAAWVRPVPPIWLRPLLLVGLVGSALAATAAFVDATRGTPGYVAAGATLAIVVIGSLADRWHEPAWRGVAAFWFGLAAALAAVAGDLSTSGIARGAAITAIAVTVLVVATWRVHALDTWHRAGTALAVFALMASVPGTLVLVSDAVVWSQVSSLVTLVLFAVAIESWTFGTLWRKPFLAETAPCWLVAAWCAFAAGALDGNAQWYTVPIGVALLGVEEIRREDHRRAGQAPYSVSGRWIEYLGMMLIVGASLFQTVTVTTAYALLAIVLGMLIATWGALTHVRRRAIFGTSATLLAVVLMLAVPLARVLPNTPGMVVWIAVAAVGVVAVLAAAFIERGRQAVRSGFQRFGAATHDWE